MISESIISNYLQTKAAELADRGNIQEKYIGLYAKAMEIGLAIAVNLVTALLLGYLWDMWWHCVVFLAAFVPLRSYAGGYHAKGYVNCYLGSCIFLSAILFFLKHFILEGRMLTWIWQLFLVSVAVVALWAPLADENKPISDKEAVVFRHRSRIVLFMEVVLTGVFTWFKIDYRYAIMAAVTVSAMALVLHIIREYLESSEKQVVD